MFACLIANIKKVCYCLLSFAALSVSAQEPDGRQEIYVQIKYQKGYSTLDTLLGNNKASLNKLITQLKQLETNPIAAIKSITIKGSASPEGYITYNRRLSEKRAHNLRAYMLEHTSLPDSTVKVALSHIDWELLGKLVANTDQPWRDEAIKIINETPIYIYDDKNHIIDGRKNQLGMLRGGRAWEYMKKNFFPDMRNAMFQIVYEQEMRNNVPDRLTQRQATISGNLAAKQDTVFVETTETADATNVAATADVTDTVSMADTATIVVTADVTDSTDTSDAARNNAASAQTTVPADDMQRKKGASFIEKLPFTPLLKTNMLYDAALLPNIGLEIGIGQEWSVSANWMHAWWSSNAKHRYWRAYGGDLEVRRWFRLPRGNAQQDFCGHHAGIYGQMLTYDFEWGGKGYQGRPWSWGAGVSYGYSLPVGKQFNIDFTLGIGYLTGDYMTYNVQDNCYVWESTRRRKWFGPTKAEVSLVWFMGGRRATKGGMR